MKNTVETVYVLENPEKDIIKFATGYQLRYDDIIKEVYGVACLSDVNMMLQFNKNFQTSICNRNGISENKIALNSIIRVATKNELLHLRKQLLKEMGQGTETSEETKISIPCPFDPVIKLQEGIFSWDDQNSSYKPVKLGA
jgi:hypothetical protein